MIRCLDFSTTNYPSILFFVGPGFVCLVKAFDCQIIAGNQLMDAGRIHFVPESKLDISHSMGFRSYSEISERMILLLTLHLFEQSLVCRLAWIPWCLGTWTRIVLHQFQSESRTTTTFGLLVTVRVYSLLQVMHECVRGAFSCNACM